LGGAITGREQPDELPARKAATWQESKELKQWQWKLNGQPQFEVAADNAKHGKHEQRILWSRYPGGWAARAEGEHKLGGESATYIWERER